MALSATTSHPRRVAAPPGPEVVGSALAWAAVIAVVLVALVGASMALAIVRHPDAASAAPLADRTSPNLGLGQAVQTSFGSVTATEALVNNGLTSADLGGMSHGVSNLVGAGSAEVNIVVSLHNSGKQAVGVDATQFRLLVGSKGVPAGKPTKVTGTTMHAGRLAAGATLDARVTFVVPSDGSQFWLQFKDPSGGLPIRIALGHTGVVKAPVDTGHQH
jgi:hypothetical protein